MFATAYAPREDRVEVAGQGCDFDAFVRYADAELYFRALEWAGTSATSQAIVDGYCELHEKRYGAPFVMPPG